MGMGDVSASVTPKFAVVAPPVAGGHMLTRYFMPKKTHPSLAVTGSQCLGACLLCPGTVADGITAPTAVGPQTLLLEHPMGILEVVMDTHSQGDRFDVRSAGLVRTAHKLAAGEVFVPTSVWSGA